MTKVEKLLADCESQGITISLAGDGELAIDGPAGSLTPDLLDRLKAHKGELLETFQCWWAMERAIVEVFAEAGIGVDAKFEWN